MNLRIGLDFDNTIAAYDLVFCEVAVKNGFVKEDWKGTKKDLKEILLKMEDGETRWMKIQGQVYGKYMGSAEFFPGFVEFILRCRLKKNSLFVVSHKTEYGHFDEEKINLRKASMEWMEKKGFFQENFLDFEPASVYFLPTRQEKIQKIKELKLTHFVDDLREVLEDKEFPSEIRKIHFNGVDEEGIHSEIITAKTWGDVSHFVYKNISEEEICSILHKLIPDLGIERVVPIQGKGNSRVFQLFGKLKEYCLKIYPDLGKDSRNRLWAESEAYQLLGMYGLPVPNPVYTNQDLNWGVYTWIEGVECLQPDETMISEAVSLVEALQKISQEKNPVFQKASEACLNCSDIEMQIERRFSKLCLVQNDKLHDFLENKFKIIYQKLIQKTQKDLGDLYSSIPHRKELILSPSDFGFHNAKKTNDRGLVFFDFEYFGWDHPMKLVSDFYWHPAMNLSMEFKTDWLHKSSTIFSKSEKFNLLMKYALPMIGLRWVMIVLGEFLKDRMDARLIADPKKAKDPERLKMAQLDKAEKILQEVEVMVGG